MKNKTRIFKYYPEDFAKLTVKVIHMDLNFDIYNDYTNVKSSLKAKALENINYLELDAKNLEIKKVECNICDIDYEYKQEKNKLVVKFKKQIKKDQEFVIITENITRPTKNILEGLYYDETPSSAPPTQITQCQQWGFQRLTPCIDDMAAKCTYITTITSDSRYTNMIANGDIITQRHSVGNGRDSITYSNTITPMATYLFFLGVGTYTTFTKEFEYPNGKTFLLELLVSPNSEKEPAEKSLQILYDGIMWIYLFTGPDKYENNKLSKELLPLIKKRDELKKQKNKDTELEDIRKNLKEKITGKKFGYEYTGTVYREIAMQNSDFGGMENVGNTTITANRIMPFKDQTDPSFEYMIRVKAHEFYHNLNGSEVTGKSPFELWLNEAVTVHIEKEYHSFLFGEAYSRLQEVLGFLSPDRGTFIQDESASSMPILPDGFNDPNDLITSITYVKAPEFVRMIEILMGKEKFVKALDNYHTKFKHNNAATKDWIFCMEKFSKLSFEKMADVWLHTIGFPILDIKSEYKSKSKTYLLSLNQTNIKEGKKPWQFPFTVSLFDKSGSIITEKTDWITKKEQKIIFKNVDEPAFASMNHNYSFYGKMNSSNTKEQLYLQAIKDNDLINRYMAFYTLADQEKTFLLKDSSKKVSDEFVSLYYQLLSDKKLIEETGAQFLIIFEYVEDRQHSHHYKELHEVKSKILKSIAEKYQKELSELYIYYSSKKGLGNYVQEQAQNIKYRQLKNLCLGILAKLDTPEIHQLIKKQFYNPSSASDKVSAFSLYINSGAKDKALLIKEYGEIAVKNHVSWESFLYCIASNDSEDYLDIIKRIELSKHFRVEQSNDQRALYEVFANNKKKSLQTEEGRQYLKSIIQKLAPINEYTTFKILGVFGNMDKMESIYHLPLIKVLVDVLSNINQDKMPSVYNTIKRIFVSMPNLIKDYEKEYGKINGLEN